MRKLGRTPIALAVGIVLLTTGCSSDKKSSDTTAAATETTAAAAETTAAAAETTAAAETEAAADTTADAPAAADGVIRVKATEPSAGHYMFEGIPATLPAGVNTFEFTNGGGEPHEIGFVQIEGDHSSDEFIKQVIEADGAPIPDWVIGATGVGTVGPTKSSTVSVMFKPGATYVYFCSITDAKNESHALHGMSGVLKIEGDNGGALPATDTSITIKDFSFDVRGLKAGDNVVKVENTGKEFHHVLLIPIVGNATFDEAKAALLAPPPAAPITVAGAAAETTSAAETTAAAPGSAGGPPFDFEKSSGTEVLGPGEAIVTTMTLEAGHYMVVCFINDKKGGPAPRRGAQHDPGADHRLTAAASFSCA